MGKKTTKATINLAVLSGEIRIRQNKLETTHQLLLPQKLQAIKISISQSLPCLIGEI